MKLSGFCALSAFLLPVAAHAIPATDTIAAKGGPIKVTAIFHASTMVEHAGMTILVDPIAAGAYIKKADLVIITHNHPDHLSLPTITRVLKPGGEIIGSPGCTAQLSTVKNAHLVTLKYYETTTDKDVSVYAVPAYNIVRGPGPGKKYHPKYAFDGYVLTIGGKRVYFAGDTEATPEMKALKNIDAAFLPMNLPYTMTPQEAAAGARAFKPKKVYPYHFRYPFDKPNQNPQQFAEALKGSGIQVKILDFYPPLAVQKAMKG